MRVYSKWVIGLFFWFFLFGSAAQAADGKPPIVIGATVSLEGKYVEPSAMIRKAFQLWVNNINEQGGLLGRKIKLILYDDKSDRELTKSLYTKLIEQDKVDLVFSPYSSPLTLAACDITERHNMLMLAVAAAAEKPWQGDARYLFQVYAPAKRQFIGLLDMMAKKNHRTLSVLYNDRSAFNRDMFEGLKTWAQIYKIDIVYQKAFQDGKKELSGLIAEVKTRDASGLVLSAYPPDCYELLRLLGKMKYRPTVLAMPIVPAHPNFHQHAGDMADRVFGPSQWEPVDRIPFPGTRRFIERFAEHTGHMPSFHAASAYAACQLFEQAINRTRTIDNRRLRDYIAALNTVTVLGRFKVDPSGKQVGHNSFIIQWQNGKKEIVWPRKMQTAQPLF